MHSHEARKPGLVTLISRQSGSAKELELHRLCLTSGGSQKLSFEGQEAVVVLLEGTVTFKSGDQSWDARRGDLFKERASALYLPPGSEATVEASGNSELIITTTPCTEAGSVVFAAPDDVTVNARGKGHYSREVHDIFVKDAHVKRILIGETFNVPGNWSSYPPHKHDGENGEPYLEEVYYYRTNPAQGFGYQALYAREDSKNGKLDEAYTVRDGSAVLISRGFHPVAAAPGYALYYLWALAGDQRELALYEDPDHKWVHDESDA